MTDATQPLKAEIMAQPAADRLDYAIDLLRFYLDPVPAFFEGCARLGLRLSARDVRMLHALDKRRGRYVSLDALQAAEMVDSPSDDWGTHDKTYQRLSKLRQALAERRLPVEIQAWSGVGYRLTAGQGFRFESGPRPMVAAE